jgi:hypothetical protein
VVGYCRLISLDEAGAGSVHRGREVDEREFINNPEILGRLRSVLPPAVDHEVEHAKVWAAYALTIDAEIN